MLSVVSGVTVVLLVVLAKATKPKCILQLASSDQRYSNIFFPEGPDTWRELNRYGRFGVPGYTIKKKADGRLALLTNNGHDWGLYWPAAEYANGCITNGNHGMQYASGALSQNFLYVVDDNYPLPQISNHFGAPSTLLGNAPNFSACIRMVRAQTAQSHFVVWNNTPGHHECSAVTGTPNLRIVSTVSGNHYRVVDMRHAYPRIGTTKERIFVANQVDINECREAAKKEVGKFEYVTVHLNSGDCYASTKHNDLVTLDDGTPDFDAMWITLHKPSTIAELGREDISLLKCTKEVSA